MVEVKIELVPVARPDGRIYQPVKPPRAYLVDDHYAAPNEPSGYVYVLGTHDVERAYSLAELLAKRDGVAIDRTTAEQTWIRQTIRDGDPFFDIDPVRGAAAVSFDVVDDWPLLSVEGKDTIHDR